VKKQKNYQDLTNQLGLYADKDHIIRCKGRMGNASSNVETRSPNALAERSQHYSIDRGVLSQESQAWRNKGDTNRVKE
jgi:hypothetical protein